MRISDWSSDVCSSDLLCWPDSRSSSPYDPTRCGKVAEERSGSLRMTNGEASGGGKGLSLQWQMLIGFLTGLVLGLIARSEERRVGQECDRTFRSRWSPCHRNKKSI